MKAPILAHAHPTDVVAYRRGEAISAARFLADVVDLAERLPAARHVINTCSDRYRFAVGLYASACRGIVSLLPPTLTPAMLRELTELAPDLFCLCDRDKGTNDLPRVVVDDRVVAPRRDYEVPAIADEQIVACIFTSGSTGKPRPNWKTWGRLVTSVRGEAAQLGLRASAGIPIVGTVPAQHSYGLESTVLLPLLTGNALCADHPFYPADIVTALDAVPLKPWLVTTPFHLKTLLAEVATLPPVDRVISATAPLSPALAKTAEERFAAPLFEIYGMTETGQLATRRSSQTAEWETMPGVRLEVRDNDTWASGGNIDRAVAVGDVLELIDAHHFLLHGRSSDLINIAGKRTSLSYLNAQLIAIEGVEDGAFYMPETEEIDGVTRLTAFVVAPTLSPAMLTRLLRERIDPVFLPRPLHFLAALPRNSTGKLPNETLRRMAENENR